MGCDSLFDLKMIQQEHETLVWPSVKPLLSSPQIHFKKQV